MSYPLLENIDKFVKENGISTNEVYISSKRLPLALIEAATKEISKNGARYKLDDTCIITYDNEGHLALVLTFNDGKTNLLITDTNENLTFPNPNFKFTRIRSANILAKAKRLDWINRKVYESFGKLYSKYLKKYEDSIKEAPNETEKRKREDRLLKKRNEFRSILHDQIECMLVDEGVSVDYDKSSAFNKELERFESVVEQYIAYINKEYIESKKKKVNNDIVYYTPEEGDGLPRRSGEVITPEEEQERKNIVLPSDFRDSVIEELHPIVTKVAVPAVETRTYGSSESITDTADRLYTCSLIRVGEDEYKLIMEPFNGTKYTRIAYIKTSAEITDEMVNTFIKRYLSMNSEHVLATPSMIRIGHTTDEAYMNSVWYAILRDKRIKCRKYFMEKVDSLVPEVFEKQPTL